MSSLTEITLQLIYKKLEEILAAIKGQEKILNENDVFSRKNKPITQEQFNKAMRSVLELVNKKKP
jgi:hypothetical protein|tara:strand:+ start:267 stop:461 length:195 start_codon:yes stop_codon:yes gene_type:complete